MVYIVYIVLVNHYVILKPFDSNVISIVVFANSYVKVRFLVSKTVGTIVAAALDQSRRTLALEQDQSLCLRRGGEWGPFGPIEGFL